METKICIEQCTTYRNHSIVALALGSSTTIATLIIPVPMIPTPRKSLLCVLLVLGTFALVFGVLARYQALTSPTSSVYLNWLVAETALLILFANLPFLIPLITLTTSVRVSQSSSTLSLDGHARTKIRPRFMANVGA
jgi:uncharacterized membrane protein HdeD (DUF308 family)